MQTESSIQNILFPTDFSKQSESALQTAIAICKRHNACLSIFHVIENGFLTISGNPHIPVANLLPELEYSGREALSNLSNDIVARYDIKVESILEFGNPAEQIAKYASQGGFELIVMGTHGASGLREFFIGSNAFAVIKNTTVPVLTIPAGNKTVEFKRILFPIRIIENIIGRYDFIAPIIERNNSELIIAGLSLPGEKEKLGPLNDEVRALGKSLRLNHTQFKSESFVCKNYAKKVLELSKKEKADLIVIDATFDYDWRQFFIGPYVQQIVHHAKVPVLSLRPFVDSGVLIEMNKADVSSIRQPLVFA